MERWAAVTGAGGGIGTMIVRRLAADGFRVAAWDLSAEALEAGGTALADAASERTPVDVTDEAAVERALAELPASPVGFVNCAGVNAAGPLLDVPVDRWRWMLDVNLTGTFICGRLAARAMRETGGAIVNIASIAASTPVISTGAYSASKAGVAMLTQQMAVEWGPLGIRVNAVSPGMIDAGLGANPDRTPEQTAARNSMVPLGRAGSAENVADAVGFLLSDDASYISGESLLVDGAMLRTTLTGLRTNYS